MNKHTLSILSICLLIAIPLIAIEIPKASATSDYIIFAPYIDEQEELTILTGYNIEATVLYYNDTLASWTIIKHTFGSLTSSYQWELNSTQPLKSITWNASITSNISRLIDAHASIGSWYFLYCEDINKPTSQYLISISDFTGITNAYLNIRNALGYLVESHSLNSSYSVPFYLQEWTTYTLELVCDQGTYTQELTTGAVYSITIPVLPGMFSDTTSTIPTASVERYNSTQIIITYNGTDTDWVYLIVQYRNATNDLITDVSANYTGSDVYTWTYSRAYPDKEYYVNVTSSIGDVLYNWNMIAPIVQPTNPWEGILDFLGVNTNTSPVVYTGWPANMSTAQIAQLVAAFIIVAFLGIGSFRNAGASAIMACIVAGIMFAVGWWNGGLEYGTVVAIPELGFAFFVAILIHMSEKKSEGHGLS